MTDPVSIFHLFNANAASHYPTKDANLPGRGQNRAVIQSTLDPFLEDVGYMMWCYSAAQPFQWSTSRAG